METFRRVVFPDGQLLSGNQDTVRQTYRRLGARDRDQAIKFHAKQLNADIIAV